MTSIQVDDRTANRIETQAKLLGLTVAEYVERLVTPTTLESRKAEKLSVERFLEEVDELSFDGPSLPPDFSRADIYSDHD